MTNEEAVETLKQLILQGTDERLKKDYEAIDIAIQALETGEVYMTGEDYNLYMEGYKAGKKDFAPKQGEWINDFDRFSCPFCKMSIDNEVHYLYPEGYGFNYCPNCGKKLKEGAE